MWFAENLNYAVAGSKCYGEGGEAINEICDDNDNCIQVRETLSLDKVQTNCEKYGRLYNWPTAMILPSSCNYNSCTSQIQPKHQGICPAGWHIPNNDDWIILLNYAGGSSSTAGTKLKDKNGWNYDYSNGIDGNGTDNYGFSALPGGAGGLGNFYRVGNIGVWWSATEYNANRTYNFGMESTGVSGHYYNKSELYSVRCIKD